jgi:hypothetical protein
VPGIPELEGDDWQPHRRYFWSLRTCMQEMSENGVDSAHFRFVHDMKTVPELAPRFDGPRSTVSTPTHFPGPGRSVEGLIEVESFGMGCDVIRYSGACDVLEIVCGIPIDPDHVEVRMAYRLKHLQGDGGADRLELSRSIADFVARQFENDLPIWEHKIYRKNPMLCDGDGPIAEFRRWCQQFYPG